MNNSRKVILYIAVSLDGFIADQNGSIDWISGNDENYLSDYGYETFIKTVDTVIMGYNTYRQINEKLSPNEWPYKGLRTYVLTSKNVSDTSEINFTSAAPTTLLEKLHKQNGKAIWICGGADVLNQLVHENLIDEYHITTIPLILGKGIRLFNDDNPTIKLNLCDSRIENGIITNIYKNS